MTTKNHFYGWAGLLILAVLVLVLLESIFGVNILTRPLGVPVQVSRYWLSVNGCFYLAGLYLAVRDLREQTSANWQERSFSVGLFVVFLGLALSTLARAFNDGASVTLGTPVITVGMVVLLYGLSAPPVRFDRVTSEPETKP